MIDRDKPLVPSFWRRVPHRSRIGRRIVQNGALINPPVNRAGLHAHDEVDGRACGGRRSRHIGGKTRRAWQRLERGAAYWHVQVGDLGWRRTIEIGRRSKLRSVRKREILRLADERHFVRSGDDRPRDRIVHDFERLVLDSGGAIALNT